MQFLYQTGAVLKTYNGSFFTCNYLVYNNSHVSNLTKAEMSRQFGGQVSGGAYTLYRIAYTIEQMDREEKIIDNMIKWGVDRWQYFDYNELFNAVNIEIILFIV